jgi:alkylhydroperoxidase family enzyme
VQQLPDRLRLAVELTDVIVQNPRGMPRELRAQLDAEFTPDQLAELTFTVALASAFSKAAIAWGPPPGMPVLEVPTPTPDPETRYGGDAN